MVSDNQEYGRCFKKRGFTLIELMVAMTVMSLGLFAVIHMQVITVRGHGYARERSQATQIALGVVEQLRRKGLEWVILRNGMPVTFQQVFVNDYLIVLETPPPVPGAAVNLTTLDLRSLLTYCEDDFGVPNPIAGGTAFTDAWAINPSGYSRQGGALPILAAGAMFRVHYVGYFVSVPSPAPPNSLVRMMVIVSWDNKDHGQDTNWTGWATPANFWRRHMVVVTFYLRRHKAY